MRRSERLWIGMMAIVFSTATVNADWAVWRGPTMNGVIADSPALLDSLADLAPLWTSETIPGDGEGGFASPAVADGKVYLFVSWRTRFKIEPRILTAQNLGRLGRLAPADLPADLLTRIEDARTSQERKTLKRGAERKWATDWVEANLTAEQKQNDAIKAFTEDRLRRGGGATDLELLKTLAPIVDKRFENQAALDEWIKQSGIDQKTWDSKVARQIPTEDSRMEDVVICLNATDGKTVWKKVYPSKVGTWGSSSTTCVADGKVYAAGASGMTYCLDAATGEEVWKSDVCRNADNPINSSFLLFNNTLYLLFDKLVALDAATGTVKWEKTEIKGRDSSPVLWHYKGAPYILCGAQDSVFCVTPDDGKIVWTVAQEGRWQSTPAAAGESMAVAHGKGIVFYKISDTAAEKIATSDKGGSRGGSLANDGKCVYSGGKAGAVCFDAATGEMKWTTKGITEDFSSPAVADGKVICFSGKGDLVMLNAEDGTKLGATKIDYLRCVSPVIVDGHLYVRTPKDMRCYNLKK